MKLKSQKAYGIILIIVGAVLEALFLILQNLAYSLEKRANLAKAMAMRLRSWHSIMHSPK